MLVVVLRPRESRCLTIRLTGQNIAGQSGSFRCRKRRLIEDEYDDEHEDEDPNFGVWVKTINASVHKNAKDYGKDRSFSSPRRS